MPSGDLPRPLRPKERDLIEAVLPPDRPGYRRIRDLIDSLKVIGEGSRGEGSFVLGTEGTEPNAASALSPVVALGAVETTRDVYTVSLRAPTAGQIDVEIVSEKGEPVPDHFEEKRRWTYSRWEPGHPSPVTGASVREVRLDEAHVLAICTREHRLWLYDAETGVVHLIPVTGFYNELMRAMRIRDPERALQSGLLFTQLDRYSDTDLREAFYGYNMMKPRATLTPPAREKLRGWRDAARAFFARRSGHDRH